MCSLLSPIQLSAKYISPPELRWSVSWARQQRPRQIGQSHRSRVPAPCAIGSLLVSFKLFRDKGSPCAIRSLLVNFKFYSETRVHGGEDRPASPRQRLQDKVGGQLERGGGEGVLDKICWDISNLCFYISLANFEFLTLLCWQECRQGPGTCWLGSLTSTAHVLYRDHGSPFDNRLDVKLMSWVKMKISLMSNWCLQWKWMERRSPLGRSLGLPGQGTPSVKEMKNAWRSTMHFCLYAWFMCIGLGFPIPN